MIEGTLRVEVDGELYSAGAGAMAFLPRERTHRFIVTSPTAHFLILHTPSGFEDFVTATPQGASPAQLKEIAASYGIEILGPPLTL
jgi:quercetin dioxygenase-like cupin family protein